MVRFAVGPVAEMPDTPTHLSLLSDSVMRTPALNELPDEDDKEGGLVFLSVHNGRSWRGAQGVRAPTLWARILSP